MAPAFSVVIPLYNKAAHIGRAVESVLAQERPDFELLVVDDGSTDDGAQVVAACGDPRLRLVHQPNQGVSAARNRGVALASAGHVAFLDADDAWSPAFLAEIAGLIERAPDAALFALAYEAREADGRLRGSVARGLVRGPHEAPFIDYLACIARDIYPFFPSSACVNKTAFTQAGGFDPALRIGEDVELWLRLSLHSPVCFSAKVGATYFRDAANRAMDHAGRAGHELAYFRKLVAHTRADGLDGRQARNLRRLISHNVCRTVCRLLGSGEREAARQLGSEFSGLLEPRHAFKLARKRVTTALARRIGG